MSSFNKIVQSPGFVVIALLGVLTAVEYGINQADPSGAFVWLTIIAFVKATAIVISFMHVKNVLGKESA